ncbi:toxin co-regulated pilus biosynthesis Q family protein [Citrobacter freundii]|uniref:toxin co-regulated pilus biosynthesis Q family protein n=1 Tax=Citrobacter freundii TaxID=546 RepID=UPI001908B10E|nr:toxin co-regulated pilus biosynthesis Q family protein [Citrobacter freundii]MBJ8931622.1 toxin co-regulated pilus biosynthesis Q family protein [Citrobacter freundii]
MNIKFIAVSLPMSLCVLCSVHNAFAGFDVVNSYEYRGDNSGLIRTSPSTQSIRMADSIFIDNGQQYRLVPVAANVQTVSTPLNQAALTSKSSMLSQQPTVNPVLPSYPSMTKSVSSPLTDEDINKLIKSLNNVTFIGKPDKNISAAITVAGNRNSLQQGIDAIVGGRYLVAIYPSASKKYGTKKVSWDKGASWVTTLDRVLDSFNLKAVVDINSGALYVSEKGDDVKSILTKSPTTTQSPVIAATTITTPNSTSIRTVGKSPFQDDRSGNQTVSAKSKDKNTTTKLTWESAPLSPTVPSTTKVMPMVNLQPTIMASWTAVPGSTLRSNVQNWVDKQGWRLVWQTNKGYNVTAPFTVHGRDSSDVGFMEAMKEAFALYDKAKYPFRVTAYPEQRLLYVTSKGNDSNVQN